MTKFFECLFAVGLALIIVVLFIGLLVWIGNSDSCRTAGYRRSAIVDARVYCVRVVDGHVEGRLIADVKAQMKTPAECE